MPPITNHGMYILNPFFDGKNCLFKGCFSHNSGLTMISTYSRPSFNQEWVLMALVGYTTTVSRLKIMFKNTFFSSNS